MSSDRLMSLILPLVNFVNMDHFLVSVNLSGGSETKALIICLYWVVVRIKCGDARKMLSIACSDTKLLNKLWLW